MSKNQFVRHKEAKGTFNKLFQIATKVACIHYSCESFYDRPDGSSPRITSIAVRSLESGQTVSFSIHQMAELEGISLTNETIGTHYNQLELKMLNRFAEYLERNPELNWLHWNMRDESYGFQAIEHRHRVLGGTPYVVQNDRKYDLSRLLVAMYGKSYIGHPRLEKLVTKNKITHQDFLNGEQEAAAFNEGRYVELHRSTLRKVDAFCNIAQLAHDGKLSTNSKWWQSKGLSLETVINIVKEHPIYTGLGIMITVLGWLFKVHLIPF